MLQMTDAIYEKEGHRVYVKFYHKDGVVAWTTNTSESETVWSIARFNYAIKKNGYKLCGNT